MCRKISRWELGVNFVLEGLREVGRFQYETDVYIRVCFG